MKKRFTILMMMLFILLGGAKWNVLNAQETITIGEGTTTQNNVPFYDLYNYSLTQQIYFAEDLGNIGEGTITSMSFRMYQNDDVRNLDIYLMNTDKSSFDTKDTFISVQNAQLVYSGEVNFNSEWVNIDFSKPFEYTGENIILCVNDKTGNYISPATIFYCDYDANFRNVSSFSYQDAALYNPINLTYGTSQISSTYKKTYKNQVQFTIETNGSGDGGPSTPAPKNVVASNNEIFDGFVPSISWDAIEDNENLYGYNVYFTNGTIIGGEEYVTKVNNNIISPETTSYNLSTLRYNIDHGYVITVRAVYEIEGQYIESKDSKSVTIKVSGNGTMSGVVYDYDGTTPLSGAAVSVSGKDEFGTDVVRNYVTTANGLFGEELPVGNYTVTVTKDEYKEYTEEVAVVYNQKTDVEVNMSYIYSPVAIVNADNNLDMTTVEWLWSKKESKTEDFESGEFSNEWKNNGSYAEYRWSITTDAYTGNYAMKSGCYNIDRQSSAISIQVNVPYDCVISFYHKVSSEIWDGIPADYGYFNIDGVLKTSIGGEIDWTYVEFPIEKGNHTFEWVYYKDFSGYSGDDAYYVDDITFNKIPAPEDIDSYNIYRKEISSSDEPVLLASELTADSYQDNMSSLPDGIYQYGVEVHYTGEPIMVPYFEEDFEDDGVMPAEWNLYNPTNNTCEWFIGNKFNSVNIYGPCEGSYSAFSNGNNTQIQCDYYMITPEITIDNNSLLSFYYISPNWGTGSVNRLTVKISNSVDGPWDVVLWDNYSIDKMSWEKVTIDLSSYAGQKVYFAFDNTNPSGYDYGRGVAIDNVVVAKSVPTTNPSLITWSNEVAKGNTFITDGAWTQGSNWSKGEVPAYNDIAIINAAATIENGTVNAQHLFINKDGKLTINKGAILDVTGKFYNDVTENLIINDGAQVIQNNDNVAATFNMNMSAPKPYEWETDHMSGWQFIASPVSNAKVADFEYELFEYDLYKYEGNVNDGTAKWINYKSHEDDFETTFVEGRGYLASYEFETTVSFAGIINHENSFIKDLSYNTTNSNGKPLANFHLLGNPFSFDMNWNNVQLNNVYNGFATVNPATGGYVISQGEGSIPVGDGFFVEAIGEEPSISYNAGSKSRGEEKADYINIIATGAEGSNNLIVKFSGAEEKGFSKLENINTNIADIYVKNDGRHYSILGYDMNTSEIEIFFDAKQMGNYSISLDVNGKFESVVLVDRLTGIETNMLIEDEYSFTATSNENPNRFVLKLDNGQESTDNSHFVYQSGEELIVNAEGSIEIIDMMGRVVYSNEVINNRINVSGFNKAAYIVRVINETDVKVEKVVIY